MAVIVIHTKILTRLHSMSNKNFVFLTNAKELFCFHFSYFSRSGEYPFTFSFSMNSLLAKHPVHHNDKKHRVNANADEGGIMKLSDKEFHQKLVEVLPKILFQNFNFSLRFSG